MPRNKFFRHDEPLRAHRSLELQHDRISGPFSFLNPTRAIFKPNTQQLGPSKTEDGAASSLQAEESQKRSGEHLSHKVEFLWRSRDNRKGRHALVVKYPNDPSTSHLTPKPSSSVPEVAKGCLRMFSQFPYWDISYLVAVTFTLGSVVWVFNAFFVWLPLVKPKTEFHNEILVGGGVTAFIGATIFEIGSVLLMFEAINANHAGCFGWALKSAIEGGKADVRLAPGAHGCGHHQSNRTNIVGRGAVLQDHAHKNLEPMQTTNRDATDKQGSERAWQWFPTGKALKEHYLYDLGFLASLFQFMGATIFWISGFTALPGIINEMSHGLTDGIYWVPQMVGGGGFIISSTLFMLETQEKWWRPNFAVLGWHIGFWNLVGALGFTLCGALGPAYTNSGAQYEASLATFWGSWAFLIGSAIQWFESLDKYPVEIGS